MSTIQDRTAYLNNPYFNLKARIFGDFSPFYATIAVCTCFLGSIILLNIFLGCCSRYRKYWQDRHTGNRWIISIYTSTPHKQPPLDLTELEYREKVPVNFYQQDIESQIEQQQQQQYQQQQQQQQQRLPPSYSYSLHQNPSQYQQHQTSQEYVELKTRESDI